MLKWSASSESDKRLVVTRISEANANVYSYNASLAVPGNMEGEHTEGSVQTDDKVTNILTLQSQGAESGFRSRNYLVSLKNKIILTE